MKEVSIENVFQISFFFRDMAMLMALRDKQEIKTVSCKIMQLGLSYSE